MTNAPLFTLTEQFAPTGDQPAAIASLSQGLRDGLRAQTLLGVTGSGKTFTVANVIAEADRPALVIAPNKTLAAQLCGELRELLPGAAVEYFVSYYSYYQPEAYVAATGTFIEKDAQVNAQIEQLRHSATAALLTRRDVVVVASVSCIYGIGSPEEYQAHRLALSQGMDIERDVVIASLIAMQYERNDDVLECGRFRVKGDSLEIWPAGAQELIRMEWFGSELERMQRVEPVDQKRLGDLAHTVIHPASHYVISDDKRVAGIAAIRAELEQQVTAFERDGKLVEAQRIRERTEHDLEMIREFGSCAGIENYSRVFDGRAPGAPPKTLLDYFPDDFITVLDESHVTLPQINGMSAGDRARKEELVRYGFRLPSAIDNRPLTGPEFLARIGQALFVSATPGPYEREKSDNTVEQLIRPTGLVDPLVEILPREGQAEDIARRAKERAANGERTLVTTLTKRMAEDLTEFLRERSIKAGYLHSDVETLDRIETIRELRRGTYDVLVGVNLLREGLDLPEVSLVAILDADAEGFLRGETALIQTIGRAARNANGTALLYADTESEAMKRAVRETRRRRKIQERYNAEHGITPATIEKAIARSSVVPGGSTNASPTRAAKAPAMSATERAQRMIDLEIQMQDAAAALEFEEAARLRDEIRALAGG